MALTDQQKNNFVKLIEEYVAVKFPSKSDFVDVIVTTDVFGELTITIQNTSPHEQLEQMMFSRIDKAEDHYKQRKAQLMQSQQDNSSSQLSLF